MSSLPPVDPTCESSQYRDVAAHSQQENVFFDSFNIEDLGNDDNLRSASVRSTSTSAIFASDLSLSELCTKFDVDFIEKKVHPTFQDIKSGSTESILKQLLSFAYEENEDDVNIEKMVKECIESEQAPFLKKHMRGKALHVNLKDMTKAELINLRMIIEKKEQTSYPHWFLGIVMDIYENLVLHTEVQFRLKLDSHEVMKKFLLALAFMTGFSTDRLYRHNGFCKDDVHITWYKSKKSDECVSEAVRTVPDCVYGWAKGNTPCIPAEVFSSKQLSLDTPSIESLTLSQDSSSGTCSSVTTDARSKPRLPKKKSMHYAKDIEGIAHFEKAVPDLPVAHRKYTKVKSKFRKKIGSQHVVEMLAVAQEAYRNDDEGPTRSTYTIFGIFMLNEFFFISKMKVGAAYLRFKDSDRRIIAKKGTQFLYKEGSPKVEYFASPLDITISSHRTTILCWLYHHFLQFHREEDSDSEDEE